MTGTPKTVETKWAVRATSYQTEREVYWTGEGWTSFAPLAKIETAREGLFAMLAAAKTAAARGFVGDVYSITTAAMRVDACEGCRAPATHETDDRVLACDTCDAVRSEAL